MAKCTFCGKSIPKGTGKLFVYSSGKTANFCSRKCEKNLLQLKRKPAKTRWTAEYRKIHKKDQKGTVTKEKPAPKPAPENKEAVKGEADPKDTKSVKTQ